MLMVERWKCYVSDDNETVNVKNLMERVDA